MRKTQVLFIGQLGGDTQVWAYGLGKRGIFSATTTMEDVQTKTSIVTGCGLIVVDINASQEQAISFCHLLRAAFNGPILLFTYESDERFQLQVYEAGIDECITKPIGIQLALAKVLSWLRSDSPTNGAEPIGQQPFGR